MIAHIRSRARQSSPCRTSSSAPCGAGVPHQLEQFVLAGDVPVQRHGGEARARSATRAIDTASRPSASATRTAAATIASTDRPGFGPRWPRAAPPPEQVQARGRRDDSLRAGRAVSAPPAFRHSERHRLLRHRHLRAAASFRRSGIPLDTNCVRRIQFSVCHTQLNATGICKSFGGHVVLDHVDLAIETGSVLALLGPNGAGKTTMVRILATLVRPDAGHGHHRRPRPAHRPGRRQAVDQPHRPVRGGGRHADRPGEPGDDGPAAAPVPAGGPGPGRGTAGRLRPGRRRPTAGPAPTPAA